MNKKLYNEEENKYPEVTKLLKKLPEVKASDDFEYNLMIKIQNGQFESSRDLKRKSGGSWVFIPAAAVALSSILLFFIFFDFNSKVEVAEPSMDSQYISKIQKTENAEAKSVDMIGKSKRSSAGRNVMAMKDESRVVVLPNDVVETNKLPFDDSHSVDVDSYIDGSSSRAGTSANTPAMMASGGTSYPQFNGFYLRQHEKAMIELYKARLDSISKMLNEQNNRN